MSDKNIFILEGRLTADPFVQEGKGDRTGLKFSIACNRSVKQADGTYADKADFFKLEFWTKKPQHWIQKLKKGTHIVATGDMKQGYAKEGEENFGKVDFIIDQFPIIIPKEVQAEQVTAEVQNNPPF